jgi:hypothetical protein
MNFFMPIGMAPEPQFNDHFIFPNRLYAYRVTAMFMGLGESEPSNVVEIQTPPDSSHGGGHARLHFVSEPNRSAVVGQPYSYDADAVSDSPDVQICYSLRHAPPGMTIDSATGMVTWTPAQLGVVEVEIKARTCSGPEGEAEQEFHIVVLSGNPGSLSGDVLNTGGAGIPGVKMKLFNVSQGFFALRTFTDSTGHYAFPIINPGTYILRADAERRTYEDEWYDDARRREDATPIVVAEGGASTANFVLGGHDTISIPTFTLGGTVTDTLGAPIAGAQVTVFHKCSDDSSEDNDHFDDSHEHHGLDRTVTTDANGSYSFTLRPGNYIVGAKKHGYVPQYFDHKRQPFEADVVNLTVNTGGIDFDLVPRTLGTGSISGIIRSAADSSGLRSFVLGFRKRDTNASFRGFVSSTYTDSTGYYSLDNLADGNYIVLAVPSGQFIPTFYNTTGGTPFKRDATPVPVTGSAVTGIDIYARPDSDDGLNTVAGHVGSDDGGSMSLSAVAPLSGVLVTITDPATDMPLSASISESDGAFYATGLAAGTFNVVFQKPDYDVVTIPVTVQYANKSPVVTLADAQMVIEGGPGAPGLMSVRQYWNLVSVPVDVANPAKSVLFPTSVSDAFDFSPAGGYHAQATLTGGAGYWLKFANASAFTVNGTARASRTIAINEGWNLIGSLTNPVSTSAISTSPAGIIASPYWGYQGAYTPASTLVAGKGYWVRSAAAGSMTMVGSAVAPKELPLFADLLGGMNSVTVSDASGNSQTLYIGRSAAGRDVSRLAMPPLPPADAFDVRFASSQMAETFPADLGAAADYGIEIRGAAAPVTVSWNIAEPSAIYTLHGSDGKAVAEMKSATGSVDLRGASALVLRVAPSSTPKAFGLQQNYPNPFNPTTSIAFQLPVVSKVTIRIYNIIGQEVATLLNGEVLAAGDQSVKFDATNLTSGVYFYRISAESAAKDGKSESFVSVKKMMLVK